MKRYLETLFRHKILFLIPVIVIPVVTITVTFLSGKESQVTALVWIEPDNILESLGARSRTANELEAQAINERLSTEAFRTEIRDRSGLTEATLKGEWPPPASRLERLMSSNSLFRKVGRSVGITVTPRSVDEALDIALDMIGNSLKVAEKGNNLLVISYTGSDPVLGVKLVNETITLYNETTLAARAQDTTTGLEFFSQQLLSQQERTDLASQELQVFREANPPPLPGEQRPPEEEAELQSLTREYAIELGLYEAALSRLEKFRLTGEAATSTRDLTFQVIDPPTLSGTSGPGQRQLGMMGLLGLTLGLFLGLVPIILLTWRDSTVRTREDVEKAVQAPAIVEVPLLPTYGKEQKSMLPEIAMGWVPRVSEGR